MQANIFIIDDNPLVRGFITDFINDMPDLHVCGTAGTAHEALDYLQALTPDLAIVDIDLPDMDGIRLLSALHTQQPGLPCLMCSSHQEPSYVLRALAAGARGYLAKSCIRELADAINRVLRGEVYVGQSPLAI